MGNVYGGSGFIADSGMQVEIPLRIPFRLLLYLVMLEQQHQV